MHLQMNLVTDKIVQETITMDDPHIMGVSAVVDAEGDENAEGTTNIDHKSTTPYTIHTAVLPKPSLIDANVNSSINAMWKIVQPEDTNTNDIDHFDEALPRYDHRSCRPVIPVSCESNEPIVEWTDNTKLLSGAFWINSFLAKAYQKDCPPNKTGSILCCIVLANLTILCSLLMDSINCSMHLAFKAQLESLEKMPPH
jgi:hypothetical protein